MATRQPQAHKYRLTTIPVLGSIPVRITLAADRAEHHFSMLSPDKHEKITYGQRPEHVKGYEVSKNAYVVIKDEHLEAAAAVPDQLLATTKHVPMSAIADVVFSDKSYIVFPERDDKTARDTFALYCAALKRKKWAAVGKFVLKTKEYCYVLTPHADDGFMLLQTFHFASDVRTTKPFTYDVPKFAKGDVDKMVQALEMFGEVGDFDSTEFRNETYERVQQVIDAAVAKEEPKLAPVAGRDDAPASNIIDVLQKSLAAKAS